MFIKIVSCEISERETIKITIELIYNSYEFYNIKNIVFKI